MVLGPRSLESWVDLDLGFGGDQVELGTKWGHLDLVRGPHQGWTWVTLSSKPKGSSGGGDGGGWWLKVLRIQGWT
jgi:hypothetical protein